MLLNLDSHDLDRDILLLAVSSDSLRVLPISWGNPESPHGQKTPSTPLHQASCGDTLLWTVRPAPALYREHSWGGKPKIASTAGPGITLCLLAAFPGSLSEGRREEEAQHFNQVTVPNPQDHAPKDRNSILRLFLATVQSRFLSREENSHRWDATPTIFGSTEPSSNAKWHVSKVCAWSQSSNCLPTEEAYYSGKPFMKSIISQPISTYKGITNFLKDCFSIKLHWQFIQLNPTTCL